MAELLGFLIGFIIEWLGFRAAGLFGEPRGPLWIVRDPLRVFGYFCELGRLRLEGRAAWVDLGDGLAPLGMFHKGLGESS